MIFAKVLLLAALLSASAFASASNDTMEGYRAKDFGDFAKKWHFVTVRFRKDTNEMRFTYANDIAYQALLKNSTDYPEGAIFAKIGVMSSVDLAFPSSLVPSGARRVQFMVRDKKKHAETGGWGYALFDSTGKTFPQDTKLQAIACAACHKLVPERGQVFSQPINVQELSQNMTVNWEKKILFIDLKRSGLPSIIQKHIPSSYKKVRAISGELESYHFAGTMDEVQPILTREALRSKQPALLLSKDGTQFSLVLIAEEGKKCELPSEKSIRGVHTVGDLKSEPLVKEFCEKEY